MTARFLFLRWWFRPTVYSVVTLLLASGGFTTQQLQHRSLAATSVAEETALKEYTEAANSYRTYAGAIAQAKQLGMDTTTDEQALADILAKLNAGNTTEALNLSSVGLVGISARIADTQAAQAAAAEEAKKYGILSLTITNGAGASVSTKQGDQETTGTASDQGHVELKLLTGSYTVVITKSGYQTLTLSEVSITSLGTTTQTPTLSPVPAATPRPSSTPRPTATPTPVPSSSTTHSSYRRGTVTTNRGTFTADIMEFDLGPGKIKVVTDTAADDDCADSCPVLSVKGYADRWSGAVAAINGTYFCPSDYGSTCAGQVNNFFWKIKNPRLNKMINEHDGLGEYDPFLTFSSTGNATFCSTWMACQNVYAGINHKPAVVRNGSYSVDENALDDKQRTAKISRAALGLTGQHLTVVVIQSATVMDLGAVMATLGVTDALNIDAGGSSGVWYNGSYKRGPGRSVPNALVFIEQ